MPPAPLTRRRRQRGLSLVELMVGIAVGLLVVAAATLLVTTQLGDNRRLLIETQVQQDLRAAADIITRQLRRTGHWQAAAQAVAQAGVPAVANPYAGFTVGAGFVDNIQYSSPTGEFGPFGFQRIGNVLQTRLAGAGWQELTDPRVLKITDFRVTLLDDAAPRHPPLQLACPRLCPDGTKDCWPTLTVRELVVDIEGEAVSDPAVRRRLSTVVRLRNDRLSGVTCPPA